MLADLVETISNFSTELPVIGSAFDLLWTPIEWVAGSIDGVLPGDNGDNGSA